VLVNEYYSKIKILEKHRGKKESNVMLGHYFRCTDIHYFDNETFAT